jgi:peroxiredoxin
MFNGGKNVYLLGVSVDPDTTLAAWATEKNYPGAYASDVGQTIGKAYGSTRGTQDVRNLFVIGPDGRITYRVISFNVLSADAYSDLEKAVDQAAGVASPP